MNHDDDTPVSVPLPEHVIESLKIQIRELRKEMEAWRPIVETAKILSQRWKENAGDFSPEVSSAVDLLFRMVNAADNFRGEN